MIIKLFFYLIMMLIIVLVPKNSGLQNNSGDSPKMYDPGQDDNVTSTTLVLKSEEAYLSHRKLLQHGSCTNRDMSISQSKSSSSGIPQYIVQIVNTCVSGCAPSHIHLHCGWFASARMVNPRVFKRLSYDDCLVNGGKALKTSHVISFTYSNSFMYPLAFKSAKFC